MAFDAARSLAGKTAIVTGSTGEGMGRQIAWTLAREGANVVLNHGTYRTSKAGAERAAQEARRLADDAGGGVLVVRADTRKEADVRRLVATAQAEFGRVDIAVANAGGDWIERDWAALSEAAWRKVVQPEIDGVVSLVRAVLPGMKRRRDGRIVLVGWDAASRWRRPPFDYAFGKAARELLNFQMSRSLEPHGVMVNMVNPGYIPYPTTAEAKAAVRGADAWQGRTRATGQDVADAVLWLCSGAARFVSGSVVRVYGPSDKEG